MHHTRWGDAVGISLALLLAAWSLFAHPDASGGPAMAGMVLAGVVAWLAGGLTARYSAAAPGVAVAALVTLALVLGLPDSLAGGATAPPLGYANANATLLTIGVAGALHAAGHATDRLRTELVVWSWLLAIASFATGSRAATICCLLLLLVWPRLRQGPRASWQVLAGVLLGGAVLTTVVLAASDTPSPGTDVVPQTVGSTRVDLWGDALDIAAEHPVRGVGPGDFSEHSSTAGSDPDLRWAHSTPMQVLAELGAVGLTLLVALVGWVIVVLGRGAVLFAALALQSTVDYVLTFPPVVMGAAFVLGAVATTSIGRPGYTPVRHFTPSR